MRREVLENAGESAISHTTVRTAPTFRLLLFLGLALLTLGILRHAWVCDDAYITMRTVDHFVHGRGLVWNPGERVQSYTHPLWMFLVAGIYFFTREPHYTLVAMGLLFTGLTVWLVVFRHARSPAGALLAVAAFVSSQAFLDYATSGLENPLTHALLALFLLLFLDDRTRGEPGSDRALLVLSLVACAAVLNRQDTVLIFGPALALVWFERPGGWRARWRAARLVLVAFVPLLLWELFSIFYYGFPFPNTAYAKLGTGVPSSLLVQQGFFYFVSSLDLDPLTLIVLAMGFVVPFLVRRRREAAVLVGVALYLVYLVRIGGDFMTGRFLTAPLVAAVVLLARFEGLPGGTLGLAPGLALFVLGTCVSLSPLELGEGFTRALDREAIRTRRVVDERGTYYKVTGLLSLRPGALVPDHAWAHGGRGWPEVPRGARPPVHAKREIGFYGYFGADRVHIVDSFALGDPLLARLPPMWEPYWIIGHFQRTVPAGYVATLTDGRDSFPDRKLASYYYRLGTITHGKLWSWKRLQTIVKMNLGRYDHLIDDETYRFPHTQKAKLADLPAPVEGAPIDPTHARTLPKLGGALRVELGTLSHAATVDVSVGSSARYRVAYLQGTTEIAFQITPSRPLHGGVLAVHHLQVPPEAVQRGYDTLRLYAYQGVPPFAIGGLHLGKVAP